MDRLRATSEDDYASAKLNDLGVDHVHPLR